MADPPPRSPLGDRSNAPAVPLQRDTEKTQRDGEKTRAHPPGHGLTLELRSHPPPPPSPALGGKAPRDTERQRGTEIEAERLRWEEAEPERGIRRDTVRPRGAVSLPAACTLALGAALLSAALTSAWTADCGAAPAGAPSLFRYPSHFLVQC